MKLRTVTHLLSGSTVTSTWVGFTDSEFDSLRDLIKDALMHQDYVFACIEASDPPSIECEVYIPVRNIDTLTIETTSDDSDSANS